MACVVGRKGGEGRTGTRRENSAIESDWGVWKGPWGRRDRTQEAWALTPCLLPPFSETPASPSPLQVHFPLERQPGWVLLSIRPASKLGSLPRWRW